MPILDPTRHRSLADLEAAAWALAAAARDGGRVTLLVRRLASCDRESPERVVLTPEDGFPGDDWHRRPPRDPAAQLAVMRTDVAELIANGQPLTLFGDNLFVTLDLSAANLPVGTRLRVGEAAVTVTPKPHDGCLKFRARFGDDALRFVAAPATRDQNRRGVYWRVVEAGTVHVGAAVTVLERPTPAA
jgi:MOSC domain-containing protein YiiM